MGFNRIRSDSILSGTIPSIAAKPRQERSQREQPPPEQPFLGRGVSPNPSADAIVSAARQRLWAAEVACYYAQKRFSQTGAAVDRLLWQDDQEEVSRAVASLEAVEQAPPSGRGFLTQPLNDILLE